MYIILYMYMYNVIYIYNIFFFFYILYFVAYTAMSTLPMNISNNVTNIKII